MVPTGSDTGMAGGRDTSSVNEAGYENPALCSIIPPGLNFAAAREKLQARRLELQSGGERLDVVQGRVTSPVTREVVGSNPTWSIWGPVAQGIERLMSLSEGSRPAVWRADRPRRRPLQELRTVFQESGHVPVRK